LSVLGGGASSNLWGEVKLHKKGIGKQNGPAVLLGSTIDPSGGLGGCLITAVLFKRKVGKTGGFGKGAEESRRGSAHCALWGKTFERGTPSEVMREKANRGELWEGNQATKK